MTDQWVRPRPDRRGVRFDALRAALIGIGAATSTLLYLRIGFTDNPAPPWLSVVSIIGVSAPLAFRRLYPEAVAILVSIAFFVSLQFSVPEVIFTQISLFVAIYTLGAWGRNRLRATILRITIIVGMFIWVIVNLLISVSDPNLLPDVSRSGVFSQFASYAVINVITNALYFGGAYFFGNSSFAAAQRRSELEARTAELAAERERSAAQAVALDRVQIARELHDVVAHHVSVMGIQAGAARRVLAVDPALASESLATIEQSARSAVDELHHLLVTLRESSVEPPEVDAAHESSSTRGVEQLDELIAESIAAQTPATLHVIGDQRPVTSLVGFTLYRLAQEALTNTRKHGGDRATADVRLRYLPGAVELEVSDTGAGRSLSRTSTGLGQLGMRERIAAVGGTVTFGPRASGGYLVRARIPTLVPAEEALR